MIFHKQQRVQTLANPTRRYLWISKGITPQGVFERQTIHHPDAQHRPEDWNGERHQKATGSEIIKRGVYEISCDVKAR